MERSDLSRSMRRGLGTAILFVLLAGTGLTIPRTGQAATCGRAGYPDAGRYSSASVVDLDVWNEFVSGGGFANGSEGRPRVSVFVEGATQNYTVTLEEKPFVEYVGGVSAERASIRLHVLMVAWNGSRVDRDFEPVSIAGRAGGNLTLAAREEGASLIVFWRWAYLECDESFVNSYYVFRSVVDGSGVAVGSDLGYFEAPRPRRGPPIDLVLLVVAGAAVSVIFLFARHTLKRKP